MTIHPRCDIHQLRGTEPSEPSCSRSDSYSSDDEDINKRSRAEESWWMEKLGWLYSKLQALFWVVGGCVTLYYTNMFKVVWTCDAVNRMFLYISIICLAYNVALLFYLSIICDLQGMTPREVEIKHPFSIPALALVGVLSTLFYTLAVWPVWGFKTLILELVLFLGFVNSAQFLPSGLIGALLLFGIFFSSLFSPYYIPHQGWLHKAESCFT